MGGCALARSGRGAGEGRRDHLIVGGGGGGAEDTAPHGGGGETLHKWSGRAGDTTLTGGEALHSGGGGRVDVARNTWIISFCH